MNADGASQRLTVVLVALFAVALLLVFLTRITDIILLVFIAALLSALLCSLTDLITRRLSLPRGIALALAGVGVTGGMVGVGALVVPVVLTQFQDLMASLPDYETRLNAVLNGLAARYPALGSLQVGPEAGLIEGVIGDASEFLRASVLPYITTGGKVAVEIFSVFAMALYFARNPKGYRDGVIALVPPNVRHIARETLTDLANTLRAWVNGQLLAMLILAVLTAVGLWVLQVPYPLAFGAFTGAVAVVPFFGTIVSTLLPAAFVLASGGVGHSIAVLMLGAGVHLFEANVIAPLIFEEKIHLPAVLTILSILIAAKILGVLGLIVAVPLLASIVVITRHVLIWQVYGGSPRQRPSAAVLVPTQEHRLFVSE